MLKIEIETPFGDDGATRTNGVRIDGSRLDMLKHARAFLSVALGYEGDERADLKEARAQIEALRSAIEGRDMTIRSQREHIEELQGVVERMGKQVGTLSKMIP